MIFIYIIGCIFLLLLLILLCRVRLVFCYSDNLSLKVGALFINYDLLKERKPAKKKKKPKEKTVSQSKDVTGQPKEKKRSIISEFTEDMGFSDFLQLLKTFLEKLCRMFGKHLYVRLNRFRIVAGGSDPAKIAIKFGLLVQSCTYIFELLENCTKLYPLQNSNVLVCHDFDSKNTDIDIKITIKLRVIHVMVLAVSMLFEMIKMKESIENNRKNVKGNK